MKSLPRRGSGDIMNNMNKDTAIDWAWVKNELARMENIPLSGKAGILRTSSDNCLKKARGICPIAAVSIKKNIIETEAGHVLLDGGIELSSEFLSSYLTGAKYIRVFLVTIGGSLELEASRLMEEGDTLSGYLLDRIGSLAVESAAEAFENRLRKDCKDKESSLSRRLSPGYCDWPIEEQFKLAKLIDFSKAGVRLTESCMMVPKKSISAVAGIGPKGLFAGMKSQCVICNKTDCGYRRKL